MSSLITELSQTTYDTDHVHPLPQRPTSYAPMALGMKLYYMICCLACIHFHVSVHNAVRGPVAWMAVFCIHIQ